MLFIDTPWGGGQMIKELWELQKHYKLLWEIENSIKDPSNLESIKRLRMLLKDMDMKIEDLQNRIGFYEKSMKKNNILLRDLEYKLKEIEKKLYETDIVNFNHLTLLDREREVLNNNIENVETELLKNMEYIEELKKEHENLSRSFRKYKKDYTRLIKEHRNLMSQYEKKAEDERTEIERISSTIDGNILKNFENLLKTKRIAVVEVIENRCSGCNMLLPSIILDKLGKDDEIVFCDNCHRMLYLP